jgi:Fe(3+) dicitrate transport protein
LEVRAFVDHALFGAAHSAIVGLRLHHEDVDRRRYNGLTPDAREDSPGTQLRDHHQITTNALSLSALDTATRGAVSVSGGFRMERIVSENRSVIANFIPREQAISKDQTIVLPGLGLAWQAAANTTVFAGIHRGFAPPRPDRDVDPLLPANDVRPEMSVNSELGARSNPLPGIHLEGTLFAMDFSELIVAGPLLGLPSGTLVNAGRARHAGAEVYARADFGDLMDWVDNPWISLSLTNLSTAEFRSDVGEGLAHVNGNRIPYAPRIMVEANIGIQTANGLGLRLGLSHVGDQFADAANTVTGSADGTAGIVPAHTTYAIAMDWRPAGRHWSVFLSGQNITNKQYVSTRTDGLFAGPRRQVYVGLRWTR